MSEYLNSILVEKQNQVAVSEREIPQATLQQKLDPSFIPLSLPTHLASQKKKKHLGIIGEIKKASPSEGIVIGDLNVCTLASQYIVGGVSGISVQTEPKWYGGSLEQLMMVRGVIDSQGLPIALIRKDYIFSNYQILESVVAKVDSIVLAVALLRQIWPMTKGLRGQLTQLLEFARTLGIEPIVEVQDKQEAEMALDCGAKVITINQESLTESQCIELIYFIPIGTEVLVSGKNLTNYSMSKFLSAKANFFTLGTQLMLAENPTRAIAFLSRQTPLIKICDITQIVEITEFACHPGITMIGITFSKGNNSVTLSQAKKIRKYLGPSPVEPDGKSLYQWLPPGDALIYWIQETRRRQSYPLVVGVFTGGQTAQEINDLAEMAEIDLIQLPMAKDKEGFTLPHFCRPIIQEFHPPTPLEITDNLEVCRKMEMGKVINTIPLFCQSSHLDGSASSQDVCSCPWVKSYKSKMHSLVSCSAEKEHLALTISHLRPWMINLTQGLNLDKHQIKDSKLVNKTIETIQNL